MLREGRGGEGRGGEEGGGCVCDRLVFIRTAVVHVCPSISPLL